MHLSLTKYNIMETYSRDWLPVFIFQLSFMEISLDPEANPSKDEDSTLLYRQWGQYESKKLEDSWRCESGWPFDQQLVETPLSQNTQLVLQYNILRYT